MRTRRTFHLSEEGLATIKGKNGAAWALLHALLKFEGLRDNAIVPSMEQIAGEGVALCEAALKIKYPWLWKLLEEERAARAVKRLPLPEANP